MATLGISRERHNNAHRNVNDMQGMVPMWDTRVAKARRPDTRGPLEGYFRLEYRDGTATPGGSSGDAPNRVDRGFGRIVRVVLPNLRRVKPVPAPA